MAVVTENAGKWPSGKFPQDWGSGNRDFAHVAPLDYGQETLFEEYEGWCPVAYKPYPGATNSQSIRYMCRKALVPNWESVASEIFRTGKHKAQDGSYVYVDTRCRLVRNREIKYPLYS